MQNKFLDAMMFRHACKEFDASKKINAEDFNAILDAARFSPSSFGFEPWKFVVIQNESLREKLREFSWGAQKQSLTASHFMIILAKKKKDMLYSSDYIHHMMSNIHKLPDKVVTMRGGFYEAFQKEDFQLLENDRAMFDWSIRQTYIALANMMTCAAYLGIDSCPIEGFHAKKMESFLAKELQIDTEIFGASCMLSFGYRINPQNEKTRQPLEDITQWYE